MTLKIVCLLTIISLFNNNAGFLLNSTTETSGNGATTLDEKRFHLIMASISEERESNRLLKQQLKQMETFVVGLQNDLHSVKIELNSCKQNHSMNHSKDIEKLKNETLLLTQTNVQLRNSYVMLQSAVKTLQIENGNILLTNINQEKQISNVGNETKKLKNDLVSFTSLAASSQFQNSTLLQSNVHYLSEQMETVKTKVSFLSSNANSQNQDFIALLNKTNSALVEIGRVDGNLSLQDQKTKALEIEQNTTALAVKDALGQITKLNDSVALMVCIGSDVNVNIGDIIKFTDIKTTYGISDTNIVTSTGKFTCEKPGLYIFSVFIMSYLQYSQYELYRNSERISIVYIVGQPRDTGDNHTGSGTVVLQLSAGDTLYVKSNWNIYVYGGYSCLSVIKI